MTHLNVLYLIVSLSYFCHMHAFALFLSKSEGTCLHMLCKVDPSEVISCSLGMDVTYQSSDFPFGVFDIICHMYLK